MLDRFNNIYGRTSLITTESALAILLIVSTLILQAEQPFTKGRAI